MSTKDFHERYTQTFPNQQYRYQVYAYSTLVLIRSNHNDLYYAINLWDILPFMWENLSIQNVARISYNVLPPKANYLNLKSYFMVVQGDFFFLHHTRKQTTIKIDYKAIKPLKTLMDSFPSVNTHWHFIRTQEYVWANFCNYSNIG